MKRILSIFALLFTVLAGFAQSPVKQLGTKTLYTPLQQKYTPVPAGYKAAYINLVSRHGSRHLTKAPAISAAWQMLHKADSLNLLTPLGAQLRDKLVRLQQVELNHLESISKIGSEELQHIAGRMVKQNPSVFKQVKTNFVVATTKKGRTKESAEAFIAGLEKQGIKTDGNIKFDYADDDNLRFFDFSKSYLDFKENGSWLFSFAQLETLLKKQQMVNAFTAKFFKNGYISGLSKGEKGNFADDIYGFYTILPAIEQEIVNAGFTAKQLDLAPFFSINELTILRKLSNAEDFLKKGPGTNNSGIQVKIAAPLLADFITTSDLFIKSAPTTADLRFAHAETIAPFAALLNLQGASTAVSHIAGYEKVWKAEQVIPFSSNIQWIFYRNSKGNTLVKFLLNEKEVGIKGLSSKTYPYYPWASVRTFYMKKLAAVGLKLDGDMHQFLIDVK